MITLIFGLVAVFVGEAAWRRRKLVSRARVAIWAGAATLALVIAIAGLPGGYMLQKVVALLVMPAGLLWCALFAVGFFFWHRRAIAPAVVGFALWIAFATAGNAMLGARLLASLESDFTTIRPLDQKPFDAVLVLGGGTRMSPTGSAELGAAGDRVMLAARLYHRGVAPLLVTSGSTIPGAAQARDLSAETLAIWRDLGIPDAAVVRIPKPVNTSEEIAALAKLARERGWRRVGLLTSAWHMRRALALAASRGFKVVPLPADFRGDPSYDGLRSLIPTGNGFASVQRAAWEYLGAAVGR